MSVYLIRTQGQSVEPQIQHQRWSTNPSLFFPLVPVINITTTAHSLSSPPITAISRLPFMSTLLAWKLQKNKYGFQRWSCHTKVDNTSATTNANTAIANSLTVPSKPKCHCKSYEPFQQSAGGSEPLNVATTVHVTDTNTNRHTDKDKHTSPNHTQSWGLNYSVSVQSKSH